MILLFTEFSEFTENLNRKNSTVPVQNLLEVVQLVACSNRFVEYMLY